MCIVVLLIAIWGIREYVLWNDGKSVSYTHLIEDKIVNLSEDDSINASEVGDMMALSKITNYEASKGIGSIVTFIGLYLGVILS